MKCLLIGGGGQDGRILQRKLRLSNNDTFVLERPKNPGQQKTEFVDFLMNVKPDQIYNLAGFSSVWRSWKNPNFAVEGNLNQLASLFEAIDETGSKAKVLVASSSELFDPAVSEANEETEMKPNSPYAITKRAAFDLAKAYRDAKGFDVRIMHLFNHESPIRPLDFVTQKIAAGVAGIKLGTQRSLSLGNIGVERDWGYAPDFVDAMIQVMNHDSPDDFAVGTGKLNSLRDLVKIAFEEAGLGNWENFIEIDNANLRPNDHKGTKADFTKIKERTGWKPSKEIPEIIAEMVHHQIKKQSGETTDEIWLDGIRK